MRGRSNLLYRVVGSCLLMSIVGCSNNPANYPETGAVSGTVTMDGGPLEGATVSFIPAEGRPSKGRTDAEGKYTLRYAGSIQGAIVGTCTVSISKSIADEQAEAMVELVPDRYIGTESELTAEVTDRQNTFDFALTSN